MLDRSVQSFRAFTARRANVLLLSMMLLYGFGCGDAPTAPTPVDPAKQAWAIRLDQHAIQMSTVAPYDTITLTAVVLNGLGAPYTEPVDVFFTSTDTSIRFQSTDRGVHSQLTVRMPTRVTGAQVIARVTVDGATFVDTAVVIVDETAVPPPIDSYILEAVNGGGNVVQPQWSLFPGVLVENPLLRVTVRGPAARTIIPKAIMSSNTSIVRPGASRRAIETVINVSDENGMISSTTTIKRGTTTLHASTTWYGVIYHDSLIVDVIDPLYAEFKIIARTPRGSVITQPGFDVERLSVAAGAVVRWINKMGEPVAVNFEKPSYALAVPDALNQWSICAFLGGATPGQHQGDIEPIQLFGSRNSYPDDFSYEVASICAGFDLRYFQTPGTYRFHTPTGATGVIEVN